MAVCDTWRRMTRGRFGECLLPHLGEYLGDNHPRWQLIVINHSKIPLRFHHRLTPRLAARRRQPRGQRPIIIRRWGAKRRCCCARVVGGWREARWLLLWRGEGERAQQPVNHLCVM